MLTHRHFSKITAIVVLGTSIALTATGCMAETNDEMVDDEILDDEILDDETFDEKNVAESTQRIVNNGHDYLFVTSARSWNAAQAVCQLNGGYLVTINSPGEEAFLAAEEATHGGAPWWIGGNDQGVEGTWAWTDGTAPSGNWAPGEPDNANGNEDCVLDNWNAEGQWNDRLCTSVYKFICEITAIPTSSTGTVSYAASNTNSANQNTRDFPISLHAGQTLTLGTCGLPGASFDQNTLLRLYSGMTQVASNNDSCGGLGSNVSYVASTAGIYTIHAGCYSNTSCKGVIAWTIH